MQQDVSLLEFLTSLRKVHERMLEAAISTSSTKGTCMHATVLVATAVERWLPGYTARIRGGDGVADGGIFDSSGRGFGHYWVEVANGDIRWVADITADQFGFRPIQLSSARDVASTYVPGDQALVDQHVAEFKASLENR